VFSFIAIPGWQSNVAPRLHLDSKQRKFCAGMSRLRAVLPVAAASLFGSQYTNSFAADDYAHLFMSVL